MCYLCMGKDELTIQRVHGNWPGKWVASAGNNTPPDPPDPPTPPPSAPRISGGFGFAPPAFGPGQGPQKITKVNSTTDPRVLWEDGQVAVIYAKDFPANTGMGRSKTRGSLQDVLAAPIDDQLVTAPGKNSGFDLIKVWLKDILARPIQAPGAQKVVGRLPIDPKHYLPQTPVVAKSGKFKGQVIPDFPHDCAACGGKCYQGMFSNVHDTPDGRCPAESAPQKKRR